MNVRTSPRRAAAALLVILSAAVALACSAEEKTLDLDSSTGAARTDTIAGDWAVDDADQQFLRIMVDNDAGMVGLARAAAERASDTLVRGNARRLADQYAAEQAEILDLLRSTFGDTHRPMAMPAAKAAEDSLRQAPPDEVGRAFGAAALGQLRSGLIVIDRYTPTLQRKEIRALAGRVAAAQRRAAADLEQGPGSLTSFPSRPGTR